LSALTEDEPVASWVGLSEEEAPVTLLRRSVGGSQNYVMVVGS